MHPSVSSDGDVRAVLFDMDGTLVDTERHWHAAGRWVAEEYGDGWDEGLRVDLVGASMEVGSTHLRNHLGVNLTHLEIEALVVNYVVAQIRAGFTWKPGALELLAEAERAGIPRAMVTTATSEVADVVLGDLPDRTFQTVVTREQVTHAKPHPEPYLLAAQRLGVTPSHCLVVEDSPTGATSGQRAGCRVVMVPEKVAISGTAGLAVVPTLDGWTIADLVNLIDSTPPSIAFTTD